MMSQDTHETPTPVWTPSPLERGGRIPLHTQITRILRRDIATGALPAGTVLPAEPALAKQWGVARATLRLALRHAENEGLVQRTRVTGTIVCGLPAARDEETANRPGGAEPGLSAQAQSPTEQFTLL